MAKYDIEHIDCEGAHILATTGKPLEISVGGGSFTLTLKQAKAFRRMLSSGIRYSDMSDKSRSIVMGKTPGKVDDK